MAYLVHFHAINTTRAIYDEVWVRLNSIGAGNQPARTMHLCFGIDGALDVLDVWASMEAFEEFGRTLRPILEELGIDPGTPRVEQLYNEVYPLQPVHA